MIFVLNRLAQAVLVLLGAATFVFFLVRVTGDPVTLMLPAHASVDDQQRIRAALGLDRPLLVQYGSFMVGLATGDLGTSLRYDVAVSTLIGERLPATIHLAVTSLIIAMVVAFPIGILSALRPHSLIDRIGMLFALIGQAVPSFWLGLLLIMLFAVQLNWMPSFGRDGLSLRYVLLPAVAMGTYAAALTARMLRSAMLDVITSDFIRTARAKGLATPAVVIKHVLRNALIPVITVAGLQFGTMLGGSVVIESVFAWPGLGRLLIDAVLNRDFALVQGCILVVAGAFVLINLLVDLSYGLLDPRVQHGD